MKKWLSQKTVIGMIVVFFLVFLMNCLVVVVSDDLGYQINNGLLDIFHREYVQYMTWTGRTVAHILARFFLAMPKIIFNIANSLCFVYFTYLLCAHAQKKRELPNLLVYLLTVCLVFLFVPLFGQTVLWETGSCNYLWTTTIVLHALLPYRLNDTQEKNPSVIGMFLLGLLGGWSNENTGGAFILLIGLFLLPLFYQKKKVSPWMWSGLVGSVLGFCMLILAPGNKIRALDFVHTEGKAYELLHDWVQFVDVLEIGQGVLWILFVIVLTLYWVLKKNQKEVYYACSYAVAGIAAVFAITLSPVPVLFDRSMFGATAFLIIAIVLCANALMDQKEMKIGLSVLCALLGLGSVFQYIRAIPDLAYTMYQDRNRNAYVEQQKQLGNVNPIVPQIYREFETTYNPLHGLSDLSVYRLQWMNQYYSQAHGIESIQSTPLEKWNTIYQNGDPALMNITDFEKYMDEVDKLDNIIFVTSSYLDLAQYEPYLKRFEAYGNFFAIPRNYTYLCGVIENGQFKDISLFEQETSVIDTDYGHYVYMYTCSDPVQCDITVDGIEYTNDNPGITLVVFSQSKNCVIDSITFDPSSDQGGIRFYIEK